jgi:hypothetical protein
MRFRLGPVSAGYLALDLGAASPTNAGRDSDVAEDEDIFSPFIEALLHCWRSGEQKHHGV